MTTQTRDHYVIFVRADLAAGRRPISDDEPVVLARIPAPAVDQPAPSNTVIITWHDPAPVHLAARSKDGSRTASATCPGAALMDGLAPGIAVTQLEAEISPARPGAEQLVPLLYVRASPARGGDHLDVYRMVERGLGDCCYVRITAQPFGPVRFDGADWLDELFDLHDRVGPILNNHQAYFTKCFPGQELEYKLILPDTASIYALAAEMSTRIRRHDLDGFILSYRDEFQTWDYLNNMYRIDAPPDARGYVSFIPTAIGGRIKQKRKWFTQDALSRREEIADLGDLETPFGDYIRDTLRVETTRMPPFRRVRYDVNLESLRTGHVFGIFFDRCTVVDNPSSVMCQCEIEYVKSRTALPPDDKRAIAELEHVVAWTQQTLAALGIDAARTFYSKLSFLEDNTVAGERPGR